MRGWKKKPSSLSELQSTADTTPRGAPRIPAPAVPTVSMCLQMRHFGVVDTEYHNIQEIF